MAYRLFVYGRCNPLLLSYKESEVLFRSALLRGRQSGFLRSDECVSSTDSGYGSQIGASVQQCFTKSSFLSFSWSRHAITSQTMNLGVSENIPIAESIQPPPYSRYQDHSLDCLRCINCGKRRSRSYCRWHAIEPCKFPRDGVCSRSHCVSSRLLYFQPTHELPAEVPLMS